MSITQHKFSDEGLTAEVVENNVVALHDKITGHKFGITEDDAYALAKHFGLIDEWVSVNESLPYNDVSVIIYPYAYEDSSDFQITGFFNDGTWFDERGFEHSVTRWKPLPTQPNGE